MTAVVRTDLGQLKWMGTEATDYTPLQEPGRRVYLREGCWYCHSQYVRPVTGETRRWGPVSEAGEYAYDVPHLFGTRRIGPDLTRVGLKYGDEWHFAHFWNPRKLTPDSIMAPYRGLFDAPAEPIKIVDDGAGNKTLDKTPVTQRLFDFASKEQIKLTPNADGLLFVPMAAQGKFPLIWTPNKEYDRQYGQYRRRDERPARAHRLCPEARHEPRQMARPVRAAGDRGYRRDSAALAGMDRLRQGSLRAALHGLPRGKRRRQRAGCDFPVQPASAKFHRRRVQVQADQRPLADRWRPAADDHPWRARHGDAGLV